MDFELNRLIKGKCLDVLQTLPDNFFDSCVSDVPYGLGKKEPKPAEILAYLQGEELDTGGDFMSRRWSIPSVNVWKEVYRVLKPGAYVLSFGGTRTFDLISMGLRFAGFINRDTIADNYPGIQWLYGSGMPKSSNLSMVIDKRLGHKFDSKTYSPISEAAKAVAHLGSGLKPSWEPILVFRKPFKGALVDNVQKHGTGAINIKGTRVSHSSEKDFEDHRKQVEAVRNKGGVRGNSWKNSSDLSGARPVDEGGRWPANMVMTHHPKCELHGEAPDKLSMGGVGHLLSHIRDGDPETATPSGDKTFGTSTRPVWHCHPECPIHLLDEQSGDRPSTLTGRADPNKSHAHPGTEFNPNSTFLGERTHHSNVYADSGGASRFFKQFMQELIVPFLYTTKANRKKAGGGEFEVEHPTLKPLALMQYLVRLVTPKGGIVLDPYCGSGTTCHAALLEECSYIGIELGAEGEYEEAVRRLEVICRQIEEIGMEEDVMEYLLSGEYNADVEI